MKIKRVTHHVLSRYESDGLLSDEVEASTDRTSRLFNDYVAFTCLLSHPDGSLYCGVTRYNGDILYRFDTERATFESLHYERVAEPFEVKIHRSLGLASDGTIYSASACLFGVDKRLEAPGGAIFRFTPGPDTIEKLAVPAEHDYIQTITLDEGRKLIYAQTYPCFRLVAYNYGTGETRDFGYLASITHLSALDDRGCFWGTWDARRHHFFKYDPEADAITWFRHGLPNAAEDSNIMYPGAGPVDCMINGGDGYLYIGTCGGSLCRLDPATAELTYLGRPSPSKRMPGLMVWKDSLLLGCSGDEEGGNVFAYDRETHAFHQLGPIIDSETGLKLYRAHDIQLADNTAYVAETDVPRRSGHLWACVLEE